jgi:predicted RNase H-like HicB family nuclease
MKKADFHENDDLRAEYKRADFGLMVRGKFAQRPAAGPDIEGLDADMAQEPTNDAVPGAQLEPVELTLKCKQDADNRWFATVPQLPGVIAYGASAAAATANAQVLIFREIADRIEQGELPPLNFSIILPTSA